MEMLTKADKAKLEEQLAAMIAADAHLIARIAEARAHGDLRENAEYHSAREEKSINDSKIRALQQRIASAQVVDRSEMPADMVFIGAMIEVRDESNGKLERLRIVASLSDDDPEDHREVTGTGPLGSALMKLRVGETVRVDLPRGERRLTVVAILES